MSQRYAEHLRGDTLAERLREWARWLEQHGMVCEMDENPDAYTLTAYGCPYYGLAQQHREVCRLETEALERALGAPVALLQSQLDGSQGCQFRVVKHAAPTASTTPGLALYPRVQACS